MNLVLFFVWKLPGKWPHSWEQDYLVEECLLAKGWFLPGRRLPTTLALVLSLALQRSMSVLSLLLPNRLSRKARTSLPSALSRGGGSGRAPPFPSPSRSQGVFLF